MKQRIGMIFIFIVVGMVCGWYGFQIYYHKPLHIKEFPLEISNQQDLVTVSSNWINGYLNQFKEKYVWFDKALQDYKIEHIEVLNKETKQVQVALTLYPKYPTFFNKKDLIQINEGDKEINCLWILRFEKSEPNQENKVIYTVSSRSKRVEYDLEEGNSNGRFSYEEEYYKDITELKKLEMENIYFYKIDNGNIYLTYDDKKSYVEAKLEQPLILEKPYRMEDGMYQITNEFTLLADHNQLYYTTTTDGMFQKLTLPIKEPILHVHFLSPKIGYVITMSGNALGGVIGIRILKTTDGGKTFITVKHNLETLHMSSKYNIIDENIMFITDSKNMGNSGILYRSEDGGKNFEQVVLETGIFNPELSKIIPTNTWEEIYDTPQIPFAKEGILYLLVNQGVDGEYRNLKALYISNDFGKTFTFVTEIVPYEEG